MGKAAVLVKTVDRTRGRLTRLHLEVSEIPPKYWPASMTKVKDGAVHKAKVMRYIDRIATLVPKGKGMLLHGPNRSGKTSMAIAILKEAMRCRFSAYFIRGAELIDATFQHRMIDDDTSLIDVIRESDLLVIDDVGKSILESRTGSMEAVFDNTLRVRESNLKATIFTTNLTLKEMAALFKPSMTALMKECLHPVHVVGKMYEADEDEIGDSEWT